MARLMRKRWEYVEVKVVKPSGYEGWYDNSLGEVFTAYEQSSDYFRIVHTKNTEEHTHIIYKSDCVIVNGDIRNLYPGETEVNGNADSR